MKEVIKMERKTISLQKVVGSGYKEFRNSKRTSWSWSWT